MHQNVCIYIFVSFKCTSIKTTWDYKQKIYHNLYFHLITQCNLFT